jgi:cytochrome c-type biogenesis protein CcmH/NrfG
VLKKLGDGEQEIFIQRRIAANICYDIGIYHQEQRQNDKSKSFFEEALSYDGTHEQSLVAMAQMALQQIQQKNAKDELVEKYLDECEQHCIGLLRLNPTHEKATMMLADIMFRKNKFSQAIEYYEQLLEKKPCNYAALVMD